MNIVHVLITKYKNLIADRKFTEILTGSFYALLARIGSTGLAMLTSVIIVRKYGPDVWGVLSIINSFLLLTTIIAVFGTNISILRFIPEHMSQYSALSAYQVYKKTQYFVMIASVFICSISLYFSDEIAGKIFNKIYLSSLFSLASLFIIFRSLADLNTNAARGLKMIKTFALMQILPSITMLVSLLGMTVLINSKEVPIYAQFAAWGITALFGIWIIYRTFKIKICPGDVIKTFPAKRIMGVSFPMFITSISGYFSAGMGTIILGMYRSEVEAGYFAVAVKIATITTFVLAAINTIAAPKFSELYHQNKIDELFYVAKKSTKLIFWTTTPILICLVLFGHTILKIIFGYEFTTAYIPMILLIIGQFVSSISGSAGVFMNMTGNHKILTSVIILTAIVSILLNLLLIPRFGVTGAAFSGMVCIIFWNMCILIYIKYQFGKTIGYIPLIT